MTTQIAKYTPKVVFWFKSPDWYDQIIVDASQKSRILDILKNEQTIEFANKWYACRSYVKYEDFTNDTIQSRILSQTKQIRDLLAIREKRMKELWKTWKSLDEVDLRINHLVNGQYEIKEWIILLKQETPKKDKEQTKDISKEVEKFIANNPDLNKYWQEFVEANKNNSIMINYINRWQNNPVTKWAFYNFIYRKYIKVI